MIVDLRGKKFFHDTQQEFSNQILQNSVNQNHQECQV